MTTKRENFQRNAAARQRRMTEKAAVKEGRSSTPPATDAAPAKINPYERLMQKLDADKLRQKAAQVPQGAPPAPAAAKTTSKTPTAPR
jgi:hypothetical protein